MITKEDVQRMQSLMSPRQPKGHPANKRRMSQAAKYGAALKQYKREHGRTWFDDMKEETK